jgi:hypothetical protein
MGKWVEELGVKMKRLSPKDQRAVTIGAVLAVLILIYVLADNLWLDHWADVRAQLEQNRQKLEEIGLDDSPGSQVRRDLRLRAVPAFEMPRNEDEQRLIFVRKFSEQVQKAGIKLTTMPQYQTHTSVEANLGLKVLRLHCRGKCNFSQTLNLLAGLYENPYLVGIEDFQLKCDPKNRQEVEITLIVSTLAR